jgi:hypothetical protein
LVSTEIKIYESKFWEKITTSKIKISTTFGILPIVTKACGALGV